MNLAETVAQETQSPMAAIMLLRHGNDSTALLRQYGVSVEEFTCIQPVASKYDYFHPHKRPHISFVVVIVDDLVHRLYQVLGIDEEGTNYFLGSEAYKRFESARSKPEFPCRRFLLSAVPTICMGLRVYGWEGRERTPVQRYIHSFFHEIEVGPRDARDFKTSVEQSFRQQVVASIESTIEDRLKRLESAPTIPQKVLVTSFAFARNPDVVATVLLAAKGICQACRLPAPFYRRSDSSPYLEIHHRIPLAEGGEDTVKNAIAICPNCHRKSHYG